MASDPPPDPPPRLAKRFADIVRKIPPEALGEALAQFVEYVASSSAQKRRVIYAVLIFLFVYPFFVAILVVSAFSFVPNNPIKRAAEDAIFASLDLRPGIGERLDDEVISDGPSNPGEILEGTDILRYTVENGLIDDESQLVLVKKNQKIDLSTYQIQGNTFDARPGQGANDCSALSARGWHKKIGTLSLSIQPDTEHDYGGQPFEQDLPAAENNKLMMKPITVDKWKTLTDAPNDSTPLTMLVGISLDRDFADRMHSCRRIEIFVLLAVKRQVTSSYSREKL